MELKYNLYGCSGKIKVGKDLVGQMIQYIGMTVYPTYQKFEMHQKLVNERPLKNPPYQIKKCADKLKDCVCLILGCTREQLESQEFKNIELGKEWWYHKIDNEMYHIDSQYVIDRKDWNWDNAPVIKLTPRKILQLLGTEGGRMVVHPNIWVNALFADYKGKIPHLATSTYPVYYANWIITDIRFPENEGKAVSDRGGLLIGVKRRFGLRFPDYAFHEIPSEPYIIPPMLMNDNEELYKTLTHESETSMGDHSWCDVIIENDGTIEELFNEVLKVVKTK